MRERAPLLAAIAVLGFVAASDLRFGLEAVRYPHALEHGEGMVLNDAAQLARGESPYRAFRDYPYTVGNYPPLYPLLNAIVFRISGFSPAFGRAVSLVSLWGGAALVFVLARRFGRSSAAAAVGALWVVTIPVATQWWVQARVDPLAAVLSFGGLAWLVRRGGTVVPALLFAAALATKHSSVFAPLAACLWLGADDRPAALRLAAWTLALTGAWVAVSLAVFGPDLLLDLGPFTAAAPWSVETLVRMLRHTDLASTFLLGLLATGYLAARWRSASRPERLATTWALVALAGVPLLGKEGSSWLYLVEVAFALGLAIGCAGAALVRRGVIGALALAVLSLTHVPITTSPSTGEWLRRAALVWTADWEARGRTDARLVDFFRTVDGPILVENAFYALATGRPVLLNPFMAKWLAATGRWDPSPLIRDIEAGKFAVIQLGGFAEAPTDRTLEPAERVPWLLTRSRFPAGVLAAIDRAYRVPEELAGLAAPKLYEPRAQ